MEKVGRREIIVNVSRKTGFTHTQVSEVLESIFEELGSSLAGGKDLQFRRFGSFILQKRGAKKGRNPKNPKKEILIPEGVTIKFRPSKLLSERVSRLLPLLKSKEKKYEL